MTQQPYQPVPIQPQSQSQNVPTPPTSGPTPPATGGSNPPDSGGAVPQAYEAQFLGNLLGTLLDTAAPIALRLLRERVRSMGAAAADDTAVAQEVNQFQTQFLGFLTPFIPIAVDLIGRIVQGATRGQAAGGPDAQSANSGGAAQADSQRAQSSYVR